MTAKQKFEARLQELGLMEEWKKQGECGKVAVEREDGIILLVHESYEDKFTEEHFPTLDKLRKCPIFVKECKDEWFGQTDDYEFEVRLAHWLDGYSDECPLFPVDVHFPANRLMTGWKDFEDDEEIEEREYLRKVDEYRKQIMLMTEKMLVYRKRIVGMIRTEFERGHNLYSFNPHPGWCSFSFYGYSLRDYDKDFKVIDDEEKGLCLTLVDSNNDTQIVPLSASDFPIEVLFNIYKAMK